MTSSRSAAYFKEEKRGKAIIANGGYHVRQRPFKIYFDGGFAEQRRSFRKKYRTRFWVEYIPLNFEDRIMFGDSDCPNNEPNPERSVATDAQ